MAELDYDDRTGNYTTANTTKLSTSSAAIIDNLEASVAGTGQTVEVEFYAPAIGNSASLVVTSWFVVNTTGGIDSTVEQFRQWPASSGGTGGSMRARMVLTNGVTYTFKVGLSATGASTTTAYGSLTVGSVTTGAMFLRVTG